MIKVTRTSPFTGNVHTLEIPCTQEEFDEFESPYRARPIQQIMPNLSADLREFLMTGITPEEWNKFIGSDDEFDDEPEKLSETPIFNAIQEKLQGL